MRRIGIIMSGVASMFLLSLPGGRCDSLPGSSHGSRAFTTSDYWLQRMTDARRLIGDADALKLQTEKLADQTRVLLCAQDRLKKEDATADSAEGKPFKLEVRSTENDKSGKRRIAPESKQVLQNYNELMANYHAALNAYLEHRQEVREHAAQFHAAAQNSNNQAASGPLQVPPVQELHVLAQDSCQSLQIAEQQLHGNEESLFGLVQTLINNRKSMTEQQYISTWNMAEQEALFLRRLAGRFDQDVTSKRTTNQDLMHGKMQEAMTDGDYVLSQKVYRQEQRKSGLLHYEVGQATKHSQFVMQSLEQLQALSPFAPQQGTSGSAPDQFAVDDENLEKEFEHVQDLYKQVQAASPKFQ